MTQTATTTTTTIPERMRASVLTGVKTLSIEQVPTPPRASDEVLVEVTAVGVCGSDTHYYRHGRIGDFVVTDPLILGHELSGRIVAVGEEVPDARIGERVAIEPQKNCRKCRECRAGHYNLCPNMEFYATPPIDGAFAQYCVIRTEFAHKVPESMSDEAAALLEPLSVAVTTMRKAGVTPGSSILIAAQDRSGSSALRPHGPLAPRRSSSPTWCLSGGSGRCSTAPPACSTLARPTSPTPASMSTPSLTPAGRRTR